MAIKPDVIKSFEPLGEALAGQSPAAVRRRIEALEKLLEGLFTIPGTNQKIGIAAALGSYIAWEARNLGMPKSTIVRMAGNIGFDALLGAIPFIGAVPDFFFRSNTRNVKLIKRYLDKHHPSTMVIDQ
jgi:hypothetical protein